MEENKEKDIAVEQAEDVTQEKTVTVEEMLRRVNKEKEKANSLKEEFETYKNSESDRIQKAIEEYDKKNKMNADELADYKAKEAEKKHQEEIEKLNAQIEELNQSKKRAEIKDIAIQKLAEFDIKANDDVLSLVLRDEAEKTGELIDILNALLKKERSKYIGDGAPIVSSGHGVDSAYNGNHYEYLQKLKHKEN